MNGPGEEARAARDAGIGLIQKVGITESRAEHCHCAHVGLWRAA